MSSNSVETLQQITKALESLHSPLSNQEIRQNAQAFLEDIKQRPEAYSYAFQILNTITTSSPQNDIVKHFALHIIENLVKNKWYNATEQEKELLKNEILNLMSRAINEQKFIKEKIVTIVVEIIKREWPQRWNNLLDRLIQISNLGEVQSELVLLTFGLLPHDIIFESTTTTTNSLSDQRRKDLMAGINSAVASLFNYFYVMLKSRYEKYCAEPGNTVNNHLISVLLNTFISYIDWVPAKVIFDHQLDMIFCQLIQDIPFRMASCECLLLFLSRKGRPDEKAELLTPFNKMDGFIQAMSKSSNFEDDYSFHKRIAQTLTILGTTHLGIYSKEPLPNNYNTYLQLMLQLLSHPSVLLSSLAIPFWLSFLKHNEILTIPFIDDLLKQLLDISLSKFVRAGDPEKSSTIQSKYSAIDFGTTKEWSNFFGSIRNRFIEIVKTITLFKPEISYTFISNKVLEIIGSLKANKNQVLSHDQTLILESHSHILYDVHSCLNNQFLTTNGNPNLTETIIKNLLELTSTDPNANSFIIECLQSFDTYYTIYPDCIQYVLNKILPLIPFQAPNDTPGAVDSKGLSGSTLNCRRRAIASLIHLSTALIKQLTPYIGQLYQSIVQLFRQNLVSDAEKVMLYHLLIVFSNNVQQSQQTIDFYKEILTPIITQWTSPEVTAAINSSNSFILYLGLDREKNYEPLYVSRRKQFQFILSTFQIFWKKVQLPQEIPSNDEGFAPFISNGISYPAKWPISTFIKEVLPNIVALTRTIHSLWDPNVKSKLPAYYHPIFELDDAITTPLLGYDYHRDQKNEDENITFLRNLLDILRDSCYDVIGYGFTHSDELYSISTLPNVLYDSVFSYLDYCENRHLKLIVKQVLTNYVKYCPTKLQTQFFDPVLPQILSLLFNRIRSGWTNVETRAKQNQNTEKENTKSEIVEDKILRDVTVEYLHWTREFTNQTYNFSFEIVSPWVYGVASCLLVNDQLILKKAIQNCTGVIDFLCADQKYHKLVGTEMFGIIIKVLIMNRISDMTTDLIGLARLIYLKLYQNSNYPQEVLSSLPNITPAIIQKFNVDLNATKSEKTQKALFKKLLNDVIGINLSVIKKESILDLPEKLFINKVSSSSWLETNQQSNLSNLFD
eukprot:gene8052-9906_t